MSLANMVARLSPLNLLYTHLPCFTVAPKSVETSWSDFQARSIPEADRHSSVHLRKQQAPVSTTLPAFLEYELKNRKIKCVIIGEQHHQPRVLAAELQAIWSIASGGSASSTSKRKLTIMMEHFNITQQNLLKDFARTGNEEALTTEYAKSSDGFRITMQGYLPLLKLARELPNVDSEILAGFPPREWAKLVMREGAAGVLNDSGVQQGRWLQGFDRWDDLKTSPDHSAYITSQIRGDPPQLSEDAKQAGLKAAQAFKDSVMAWKIDGWLKTRTEMAFGEKYEQQSETEEPVLIVICGSGHCEYDFGVTERIQACDRDEILLLVTAPDDGRYWQPSTPPPANAQGRPIADGLILYEPIDV